MRAAVLFDFLVSRGGAEQFTWILAKAFRADVYTAKYLPEKTCEEFQGLNVISADIKSFPRRGFTQQAAMNYFSKLNLNNYDIILSSGDWCKLAAMSNHPILHYEHTPVRMLYDMYETIKSELPAVQRHFFALWARNARKKDQLATKMIDKIVCNSCNVRKRIEKYYGIKNTPIIHPPILVNKFRPGKTKGYFLSVQRIGPPKRIEIQLEAFAKMPDKKLIIVGDVVVQDYYKELLKNKPRNVEFAGQVNQKRLAELYSHCTAVIQTSMDEDFGRIPIEANASGKSCIAVNEGGFKETITNGKNGVLINRPYVDNLVKAVNIVENRKFSTRDLVKESKKYSDKVFVRKMKKAAKELLQEYRELG